MSSGHCGQCMRAHLFSACPRVAEEQVGHPGRGHPLVHRAVECAPRAAVHGARHELHLPGFGGLRLNRREPLPHLRSAWPRRRDGGAGWTKRRAETGIMGSRDRDMSATAAGCATAAQGAPRGRAVEGSGTHHVGERLLVPLRRDGVPRRAAWRACVHERGSRGRCARFGVWHGATA